MNLYGKPYISIGELKCRMCYHFSIKWWVDVEIDAKKFGYWFIYYDGYYRFFSIYPIVIRWHKIPEEIDN